jgi:methylated-DNA-[protein]-cysteine S-methyltransferase
MGAPWRLLDHPGVGGIEMTDQAHPTRDIATIRGERRRVSSRFRSSILVGSARLWKHQGMTSLRYRTVDSPVGPLTLAGSGSTVHHLRMTDQTHEPDRSGWQPADPGAFADAVEQLGAYFAGELTEFKLALELDGTEFQRRVWAALQTIPYGEVRSYGQIAEQIGSPGASRAVGLANGRNPISIIIPCHRVIGSGGGLTGYGGGLHRKQTLLAMEKSNALARAALF